jgi:hypothetical protein
MTHVPEIARPSVASQGRGSPEQPPPSLPPEAVYAALNSRPEGLTETEAQEILTRTGPNRLVEARTTSPFPPVSGPVHPSVCAIAVAGSIFTFIAGMASFAIATSP